MKLKPAKVLLALMAAAFLFTTGFSKAGEYAQGQAGYLKSATYYSNDWVINFWNSESSQMEAELKQIAEDGFNSIILVVPWREFQPGISPVSYNDYAWEKLERIMNTAAAQNLGVMLRAGYTWDYAGTDSVLTRYTNLMKDEATQNAWKEYVGRLYEKASAHENFCGGFLTWEDFWNFADASAGLGKGAEGKKLAAEYGYVDYARANYSLEQLSEIYGTTFQSYEDLYFPDKDSYGRKVFYSFYDDFLNKLLAESQSVFPDLSMEVRLDVDPVKKPDGTLEGYMHRSTYPSENASFTGAMYSVPMGFENNYERVSAEDALAWVPVYFNRLRVYGSNKPIYIDQFLFTDNTVGFEHNAQLLDDQKEAYLEGITPLFKAWTMGYGIWTYRDYGDNKLYNAQFGLDTKGWTFSNGSSVVERNGSKMAVLPTGGRISQNIANRATGNAGKDAHVSFWLEGEGDCRVTVTAAGKTQTLSAGAGQTVELSFENSSVSEVTISCQGSGRVYIDDVKVYTFVTEGELYHMDGSEGACIGAVKNLNQSLVK